MNEKLRLQVVKQFKELNLEIDEGLKDAVLFASQICNTPISSITLLDKDTQWLKVKKGLDIHQTPRKLSFCTHAIKRKGLFMVNDMQADARFASHPFVAGAPSIRFYAGVPLITHQGHRLGTLCVMDYKPNDLTDQQKLMLAILAKNAMSIMELKLSFKALTKNLADFKMVRAHQAKNEVKLRSMFESMSDAYFLLGEHEEIVDFNHAAYLHVENISNLCNGRLMAGYLNQHYRSIFTKNYQLALNGTKTRLERLVRNGNNQQLWWECFFAPVKNHDGEITGVSYVVRNINERKLNHEKIIAQNNSLAAIALIQSHEYRGPLASILGLMHLIENDDYAASKQYLQMLHAAANKLDEKIHQVVNQCQLPLD